MVMRVIDVLISIFLFLLTLHEKGVPSHSTIRPSFHSLVVKILGSFFCLSNWGRRRQVQLSKLLLFSAQWTQKSMY